VALSASIPKDLRKKKLRNITTEELRSAMEVTGLSKIQAFHPEKKKYELEVDPFVPTFHKLPIINEKKKVEYEVPPGILDADLDSTLKDVVDLIENEYKKAAIEVPDYLDKIKFFEEKYFTSLETSLRTRSFK